MHSIFSINALVPIFCVDLHYPTREDISRPLRIFIEYIPSKDGKGWRERIFCETDIELFGIRTEIPHDLESMRGVLTIEQNGATCLIKE